MASRSVKLDEPPDDEASWTMVDIQLDLSTAVVKAERWPKTFRAHRTSTRLSDTRTNRLSNAHLDAVDCVAEAR